MPVVVSVIAFVLLGAFTVLLVASLLTSTRRPGDTPAEEHASPAAATRPTGGDQRAREPELRAGGLAVAEGDPPPAPARRRISARRRRAEAAQQARHVRDLSSGADRSRATGESQR